ncbi:hypothetical protein [Nocardioides montaniterrae]
MAFCTSCGHDIGGLSFCGACGARSTINAPVVSAPAVSAPAVSAPAAYAPPAPVPAPPQPFVPPPPPKRERRWTAPKLLAAMLSIIGFAAVGFLATYFLAPEKKDSSIPPAPPQLAASSSQSDTDAPDPGTDEGKAWAELTRIAAQDRAALQSSQQWRAQLASSPATESAASFLARYRTTMQEHPNSLLAWSGDWPQSYGDSSRHSWVLLSDFTSATTRPILGWCASNHLDCWAKRLSDLGTSDENTDHPPADPGKN